MKENTVRLSIDIPLRLHILLKTRAASKGMTIRECVIESLAYAEEKEAEDSAVTQEMDRTTFRDCFEKLRKDKWQLARNLSKL